MNISSRQKNPGILILILGLCAALSAAEARPDCRSWVQKARPMADRDVLSFKSVSGFLSPDGETVLYVVQRADLQTNENRFSAWKVPFAGGEPVRLTRESGGDRIFRWSPDGRFVSFLGERGNERGLFVMNPNGGEPERLFSHGEGISQYQWGPDGLRIAFISPDELPADEELAKKEKRDVVVEDGNRRMSHIWIFELEAEREWRLTSGSDFTVLSLSWNPDGKSIAFAAVPSPNTPDYIRSDIYEVPVAPPEEPASPDRPRPLLRPVRLTVNAGEDLSPQHTPDGRFIVYRSRPLGDLVSSYRILRIPAGGGVPEDISPRADISVGSYSFDSGARSAYFAGIKGVEADLYRMSLEDRIPVRLTPGKGVRQGPSFSTDMKRCIFTFQDPLHPQELFASDTASWNPRPLTNLNGFSRSDFALAKTEIMRWRSTDNLMVEGLLVHPPGEGSTSAGKFPLIVDNHGGPAGLYMLEFDPEVQYLAGRGYFVFRPNFRGSAGYGEAFRKADIGDWGGGDYRDIMTGIQAVLKIGRVDRNRIGVMGWSYGGYMTAWSISRSPLFKAAVVGAGMVDHLLMWGTQDSPAHYAAYFGGSPFKKSLRRLYHERSPLTYIKNIKAPVLILHGREDTRVPPSQALLFYNALKANRSPVELVWYPRTGHSPQEPGLRLDLIRRRAAWFARYLLGKETATTPPSSSGTDAY